MGWKERWEDRVQCLLEGPGFFRLFDTYTAFEEIAMFLGGLAVPLKEIPEVPDKIMVGIKGFDQWKLPEAAAREEVIGVMRKVA